MLHADDLLTLMFGRRGWSPRFGYVLAVEPWCVIAWARIGVDAPAGDMTGTRNAGGRVVVNWWTTLDGLIVGRSAGPRRRSPASDTAATR